MSFHLVVGPVVTLASGILILVFPRLLSTIVAVYLILFGLIGLLPFVLAPGAFMH